MIIRGFVCPVLRTIAYTVNWCLYGIGIIKDVGKDKILNVGIQCLCCLSSKEPV